MKIKAFIFDAGGILCPFLDNFVDRNIAHLLNIKYENFMMALNRSVIPLIKGQISEKEFWVKMSNILQIEKKIDNRNLFLSAYRRRMKLYTQIYRLLKSIKHLGFQLVLLSNSIESLTEYNKKIGMYKPFDKVFISNEIGLMKPDKEAFLFVLKKLSLKIDEVVFIDDKLVNIEAASSLGITAIHFKNYNNLVKDLKTMDLF